MPAPHWKQVAVPELDAIPPVPLHDIHTDATALEYWPGAQLVQVVAPSLLQVPTLQVSA